MTAGGTAYRKKLIEVALPLEAINVQSAREKSIRHGHPSTLHLWWARRPLAACRAVLFASIVDDPSSLPEQFPTEEAQDLERGRIFRILEELVKWENSTNEPLLHAARTEIARSAARTHGIELPAKLSHNEVLDALRQYAPPVLDPFCGGGSIPLEAQRLGLEAHGSDLNPVAVLITKALIEIPPKFAGQPPVNPQDRQRGMGGGWKGATGLAADVRYYGKWMRDEAEKRIGHLYPKVRLPAEQGGGEATVIAWLWARTVKCPNPACGAQMPLVRSFALSTKPGKEAWVEPVIDHAAKTVRFEVKGGKGSVPEGTVNRKGGRCIVCDSPVPFPHIRSEGRAGRMSQQLMAIVAEGTRGRAYVTPAAEHDAVASSASGGWKSEDAISHWPGRTNVVEYGMTKWGDLFTPRQLVALTTFSDLVGEARERVRADAVAAGLPDDGVPLHASGSGAAAYADAVATYLAMGVDKGTNLWSSLCSWMSDRGAMRETFARQAIPMIWDYAEANPFSTAGGNFLMFIDRVADVVSAAPATALGVALQVDATSAINGVKSPLISTDPPYYDNIGYADLSDFFYVWLRRSLNEVYPSIFGTLLTPKSNELIASPYRHAGGKKEAERFFEDGLAKAFGQMHAVHHSAYPLTLFYAFKQAEKDSSNGSGSDLVEMMISTGWETMLTGLIDAGFAIGGTWPMRTEGAGRILARGSNALASSIVLVCRPRPDDAPMATRADFVRALRQELPRALRQLQHGNIAPVDLAQAAIGPGMAVFSRYSKVLEPNGDPMRVRSALQLINSELDHVLTEQEAEYGPDTRWAVSWFDQFGMQEGEYGLAETLSRARNVSVSGLVEAGIVESGRGKVRLKRRDELNPDWDPASDRRPTIWEMTQHLILRLEQSGELSAADLLARLEGQGEAARDLAYRLYTTCERKGWAQEAIAYNSLVIAWPEIQKLAGGLSQAAPRQQRIEM